MLCELCHQNKASVFYKHIANGSAVTWHVCTECAGSGDFFGNGNNLSFIHGSSGLLKSVFLNNDAMPSVKSCPLCGSVFKSILDGGKAGCGECYTVFRDEFMPSVSSIHGAKNHTGHVPPGHAEVVSNKKRTEELKADLKKMIAEENYEKAAEIRDEIKKITNE